jgi:hypothetical protein
MSLLGGIGTAGALAVGTPPQKQAAIEQEQIPLKMAQIQNEMQYRKGLLGIGQQKADTGDQNANTNQQKANAGDQNADTKSEMARIAALRQADSHQMTDEHTKQIEASLKGQVYVDPNLAHALHADDIAGKEVSPIEYANRIGNIAKSRGFHTFDTGRDDAGDGMGGQLVVDNVGQKISQVSKFSPSVARGKAMQDNKAVVDMNSETGSQQYDRAGHAMDTHAQPGSTGHQMVAIWQPAQDSGERLQVMQANLERGLKGDQQAMLSLLANHLGMTMGLQKGARLNQAIISEAQHSTPWLQGMQARFDDRGYLSGVTLAPQQMQQMVELGQQRYQADVQKSRYEGNLAGLNEEPMLPIDPDSLKSNPKPAALPKPKTGTNGNGPVVEYVRGTDGKLHPKGQ